MIIIYTVYIIHKLKYREITDKMNNADDIFNSKHTST